MPPVESPHRPKEVVDRPTDGRKLRCDHYTPSVERNLEEDRWDSLLHGMASALDLSGDSKLRLRLHRGWADDFRALTEDWQAVSEDFRDVLAKVLSALKHERNMHAHGVAIQYDEEELEVVRQAVRVLLEEARRSQRQQRLFEDAELLPDR